MRVGLAALTMAEYFRMTKQDVLLFIDNIFRFVKLVLRYQHYWVGCPQRWDTNRLWQRMGDLQAHHLHNRRVNYVNSSGLRPSRRLNRPSASHDICSLGCYNSAVSRFGI